MASIAGGIHLSILRAKDLGCNTLQIFSHNPRSWKNFSIPDEFVTKFKRLRKEHDINPVFIHTSYLINIASPQSRIRDLSIRLLIREFEIAELLEADYIILHPGSSSTDESGGRKRAKEALRMISSEGPWAVKLLLENTASKRGDISSTVEDLADLIEGAQGIAEGICLDTCHAFQSGYDIRSEKGIEILAKKLSSEIGLKAVKLIHLNDSKRVFHSGIDRHEHIGKGSIGMKGFRSFLNYHAFKDIPIILETPKRSDRDDRRNLKIVMELLRKSQLESQDI